MNNHIYKVIKWVENPESVSQEERGKNKEEAAAAYDAVLDSYAANYDAYSAVFDANASYAAYSAAYFADDNDKEAASRWVNNYFEETRENKQDYINAIGAEK